MTKTEKAQRLTKKGDCMRIVCGDCGMCWYDVMMDKCIFCQSPNVAQYWRCPGCGGISMRGSGDWGAWCRKCCDKHDAENRRWAEGNQFDAMLRSHGRRRGSRREPHWAAEEEARAAAFPG